MVTPDIKTFVLGDYQTNCFVVSNPGSSDGWIVDCGFEPDEMLDWIQEHGIVATAMLLTHAHSDHIAGIDRAIQRLGPMPIYVHEAENGFCSDPVLNLSAAIGMPVCVTEPDRQLHDGDTLTLGDETWRVVHTPGHSPGGVLFIHDSSNQAIVGDTLFAGSIGRIDFPTSDPDAFRHSILKVMMDLPDDLAIHPGHGPASSIGRERATNPFVVNGF